MEWLRRGALVALSLAAVSCAALAQDYPTRPLTFVVPFTPGAATDFLARLLGKELEERLGKTVVVENRPGAGTTIGSNSVAKAAIFFLMILRPTRSTLFPYTTLFRSTDNRRPSSSNSWLRPDTSSAAPRQDRGSMSPVAG